MLVRGPLSFFLIKFFFVLACLANDLKSFWNQPCLWICQNDAFDPEHDFFGSKNTKPIWSFHTLWRDNFKIINLIKYFNTYLNRADLRLYSVKLLRKFIKQIFSYICSKVEQNFSCDSLSIKPIRFFKGTHSFSLAGRSFYG